jgi:RHH-type transcriptional regulator, proline utilization regulon repressor / proline dehydrogenase / delta 1-pyrroline-5-carboxylate dehydrogenase
VDHVIARVSTIDCPEVDLLKRAATLTGASVEFSTLETETDAQLAARISCLKGEVRLRLLTSVNDDVLTAAHSTGVTIDDSPVTGIGRIDLLRFLKEQAISRTLHRYGRLIR